MTDWIKCSDRIPENFKCVLVYNEYGEYWTGFFNKEGDFYCDNEKVPDVTHWQPLSEPPK